MELKLSSTEILSILKRYNPNYGPTNYVSHQLVSASGNIDGFLAQHYYLTVSIAKKGDNQIQNLEFFVKYNTKTLNYLNDFGVFKKETKLYSELIPRLLEFSNGQWAANCYFLIEEQMIVLENVMKKGFHMLTSPDLTMDHKYMMVALQSLAVFHASSFTFENKVGAKIIDLYPDLVEENAYPKHRPNSMRYIGFHNATKTGISPLIAEIPKYKNSIKLPEIIEKFHEKMLQIADLVLPSKEFPNCFNHGDLWCNNLMFKYDIKSLPIACKFVDFQLTRYSPQAVDVMSMIMLNCRSKTHKKYLKIFLETYYKAFSEEIKRHKMNPDDIISWETFEKSCNRYHLLGHIEAALFSHLTLLPKEMAKELVKNNENYDDFVLNDRSKICLKAFKTNENYRSRMTDILESLIDDFVVTELE